MFALASALLATTAVAANAAGDAPSEAGFHIERGEDSVKVQDGTRIHVTNRFGDVRARYGGRDGRLAVLRIVQQFTDEGPPIEVEHRLEGDVLRVDVGVRPRDGAPLQLEPSHGHRKRAELVLFVPEDIPLHVRTDAGFVQLRGLRSDVVAHSGSGDMQVRSVRGSMELATETGDMVVILESLGPDQAQRLLLGSGDLELHLREDGDFAVAARSRGRFSTEYSLDMGTTGRDGAREARVVIGEGTTPVRVQSDTGAVRLLRKPSAEGARVAPEQGP